MHVLEGVEVVAISHDRPMALSALQVGHGSIISRTERQICARKEVAGCGGSESGDLTKFIQY